MEGNRQGNPVPPSGRYRTHELPCVCDRLFLPLLIRPPVPVPLLDRVTVWMCLAPLRDILTRRDILHRPALHLPGARSVRRATKPPPKPRAHPWYSSAAPGRWDRRTPPTHLPSARLVPGTPQAARRQSESQQFTWAPRVVSALDRHKDAGILQCTTTCLTSYTLNCQ